MSFKYWMLCIVLFIITLFLAVKSYDALTDPLKLMPDKRTAQKSGARTENSAVTGVVTKPASAVSYNLIARKNIFSPERKDFQGMGPGSAVNTVIRPQVILYGVTIARNYQSALVVNPGRSLRKGERDLMTLKLGERIGEYKLTKVLSDRITLEAQGDAFEVFLYDAKVPKEREAGIPTPFVGRETARGTKELAQGRTSPSQIPMRSSPSLIPSRIPSSVSASSQIPGPTSSPSQIPGPTPTPTQTPAPMVPTPAIPPFTGTLTAPPPEMGQLVPVPPEMGQPVPVPLEMGQPVPPQPSTVTKPPSLGGR